MDKFYAWTSVVLGIILYFPRHTTPLCTYIYMYTVLKYQIIKNEEYLFVKGDESCVYVLVMDTVCGTQ